MSMCPAYATPLAGIVTRADRVSPQQRMQARASRRFSRNDSHTIYHYNQDGIADYCYTFHQSFHGHGSITETILMDNSLCRRVTYENGTVRVQGGLDASRWVKSQRRDLHFADAHSLYS